MASSNKFSGFRYKTSNAKRGIALVINDSGYGDERREGSEKDTDDVTAVLEKLGFDVRVWKDLTVEAVRSNLKKVSKEDHTDNDCLVIVAMGHGNHDRIKIGTDDMPYDDLWKWFMGNKCPSLIDKPKLVFLQTCRGNKYGTGVPVGHQRDAKPPVETAVEVNIPMFADLLVMYATYDRHVSFRNVENGSWFIQSLCAVLQEDIGETELMHLLTHVSYLVANEYQVGQFKQIPAIYSMLTKQLYFEKKIHKM